ncbi:MAG: MMPL family transporter [Turneriella sp.]|nr:MMPL family transporter [Turneriella sp.]
MELPGKRLTAPRRFLLVLQLWLARRIYRSPGKILTSVLVLSLVSGYFTFRLFRDIRTDFATLLPENDRSVLHVKEVTERIGGVGNIFVSISSPDFAANKRFVEALAERLRQYPPGFIKFFAYHTREEEKFFLRHAFFYLELSELKELRAALRQRLQKTRLAALGLDLEESDPNTQIKKLLSRLFDKYKAQHPFGANKDSYFTDESGKLLAMIIRPSKDATDLSFCRKIVERLNADIASLNPQSFHPQMEVGLAGTYVALLENFSSVIADTIQTAGLTIFLVLGSIYLFYRSFRMVVMLCAGITAGILITFMLTWFHIGYLNQQTAFLASIIVGNGINFGLIQMARYLEERGHGRTLRRAVVRALVHTMPATFLAALGTALAYGIMSVTTFRGFSQFGFIGGTGMLICWAALTVVQPCLMVVLERRWPQNPDKLRRFVEADRARFFARFVCSRRRPLVWLLWFLVPLSVAGTALYLSADRFEYDLKKLTIKTSQGKGSEAYYMRRIDAVLGMADNPSILLAASRDEARAVAEQLRYAIATAKNNGKPLLIETVQNLDAFYPQNQQEKLAIIKDLRVLLKPKHLALLAPEERRWGIVAINALKAEPFAVEKMPESLLRIFREQDGTLGRIVYVIAGRHAVLSNIKDVMQIGREIASVVDLAEGRQLSPGKVLLASESLIFTDILADVMRDGPFITALAFVLVGVLITAGFRRARDVAVVFGFLAFGILAFIAILWLFSIRLNFFNFITIPITIGIGVDYAINLYYRYRADNERSIEQALAHTGSAIALCSWTTIIGYGTMLWAKNQAMASFGLMAVIGEFSCLGFALIFMPAWLAVREEKRQLTLIPHLPTKQEEQEKKAPIKKHKPKSQGRQSRKRHVPG